MQDDRVELSATIARFHHHAAVVETTQPGAMRDWLRCDPFPCFVKLASLQCPDATEAGQWAGGLLFLHRHHGDGSIVAAIVAFITMWTMASTVIAFSVHGQCMYCRPAHH